MNDATREQNRREVVPRMRNCLVKTELGGESSFLLSRLRHDPLTNSALNYTKGV